MTCPKCGSTDVTIENFQEDRGSVTRSKTKFKFQEKKHGCLWWFCGGWLLAMFDLLLWFVAFFPRLIMRLFAAPYKKKKYKGKSKTVSRTKNKIGYRTIYTCQGCGYQWHKKRS